MTQRVPRAGQVFYVVAVTTSIIVGALQAFRVRGGFLTNWGADVFGTAWLYALFRQGRTIFQRGRVLSPKAAAAIVLAGCAGSEFAQKWHWIPGTFDRFDLAAYVATVLACYLYDARVQPLA